LNSVYPQLGVADTFTASDTFNGGLTANSSTGSSAITGNGTMGDNGIQGTTDRGSAIYGNATGAGFAGYFVNNTTTSSAVYAENHATGNPGIAVALKGYVANSGAIAVLGKAAASGSYGVLGENTAPTGGYGVCGSAAGNDSNGVYATSAGTGGYGVYAVAEGGWDSTRWGSAAVYGSGYTNNGVVGVSGGHSNTYVGYATDATAGNPLFAGVWGDLGPNASNGVAGITGTADNNFAGFFVNNTSNYNTIYAQNNDPSGGDGLFRVFKGSTPNGTCGIGDGDLLCTGGLKALATTARGTKTVETYSVQSAENWMEDFGTGLLEQGVAVIRIDSAFADTISNDASYHVFLTPRGDSKGLYVINATPSSFEVREAGGGTSTLAFDYRIVGKRLGHEAERLVDVTEKMNLENARTAKRMLKNTPTAETKGSPSLIDRYPADAPSPAVPPRSKTERASSDL